MDFDDAPEEAAWRTEVRTFMEQHRDELGTAESVVQVHGGIGFTWEHDAHLYWRRSKVDRFLLGDDIAAYDEVARLAMAEEAR